MKTTVEIYQRTKKLFVTVQPKNSCKLEFADKLWIPFHDQPQSDIVVFAITNVNTYYILLKRWKRGKGPNEISTFN